MTDRTAPPDQRAATTCRGCKEPIDLSKHATCRRCDSVHCPYCARRARFWRDGMLDLSRRPCRHFVAGFCSDSGDWDAPPPFELPQLRSLVAPIDEIPEHEIDEIFGDLRPLLDYYELEGESDGALSFLSEQDEAAVLEALLELVGTPARSASWSSDALGMGSSGGYDFFAAEPERFRAEVTALLRRLDDALRTLAARHPLAADPTTSGAASETTATVVPIRPDVPITHSDSEDS